MTPDNSHERGEETTERMLGDVRQFVVGLLERGFAPPQISFGLAFVATELGLSVANNPSGVFAVVLQALASAANGQAERGEEESAEEKDAVASGPAEVSPQRVLH
jgi:hypothetical protein